MVFGFWFLVLRDFQECIFLIAEFNGGQVKMKEEIHNFWDEIWGKTKEINLDNPWYKDLEDNFSKGILPKEIPT